MLQANRLGDLLVARGALSQNELCLALATQRGGTVRLGDILVRDQYVARRVIYSTLAQQWTVRALAAGLTCVISLSSYTIRDARAGIIDDVPARLALVSQGSSGYKPAAYYPLLFGTEERSSTNITPFVKWSGMFVHFAADMHKPQYQRELADWRNALRPMVGLPLKEQAERVNAMMNAQPYVEDIDNYHVSDYWADPLEFLAKGGDCEDYAIAKYASLRMLGVPDDHMRLAIVKDMGARRHPARHPDPLCASRRDDGARQPSGDRAFRRDGRPLPADLLDQRGSLVAAQIAGRDAGRQRLLKDLI